MNKYIILLTFICLDVHCVWAQYEDRFWVFGRTNTTLNTSNISFDFFPTGTALYNTNEAPPEINPPPANITSSNGFEGWGVVTKPETGELLFYTDGNFVYDGNHQDITPDDGLGANSSSSQAVAVAVRPVCPFDQYYIFSNSTGVGASVGGTNSSGPVTYRIYTIGGGFSPVLPLPWPNGDLDAGEGMTVIPSKTDPFTFWLIVRLLDPSPNGSNYVVYRINESGINFHVTHAFGPAVTNIPYSPIMNMTYVDDGSIDDVIVGFSVSGSPNQVFTNVFDTTTGNFVGPVNMLASFSSGTLYDLEFSPAANFVYYATYFPSVLYQVPINGGTATQLRNFGNLRGGGLKRAPDGFIYHIYDAGDLSNNGNVRIGRIVQAETTAIGSNFDDLYQADFNSGVSMIFEDVFSYNFPEFANVPNWSANIFVEGGDLLCSGNTVTLMATIDSQGESIMSYNWFMNNSFLTNTTSPSLAVSQGGVYQVEVLLAGGCTILSNELVVEEITDTPQIDDIIINGAECGEANGSITIDASGGNGPLMYTIGSSGFQTSNNFINLVSGVYSVVVIDENGCTITQEIEVLQEGNVPGFDLFVIEGASCLGNDGRLSITASGGTGVLRYSINNGIDFQSSPEFSGLVSGMYNVVVVDAIGCSSATVINLSQIDDGPIIEGVSTTEASCSINDGSITISASGMNMPLSFSIDGMNFQTDAELANLAPASYIVRVQDAKGCVVSENVEVLPASVLPLIQSIDTVNPSCDVEDGQITIIAASGTGDFQYSIDGFSFQVENTFSYLGAGSYMLSVRDELSCSVDSVFVLNEGRCPIFIPNVFSPNNDGVNDYFQVYTNGDPGTIVKQYQIFDRWGELVHDARNLSPNSSIGYWNGTFRGESMEAGVFIYIIEIVYADGFTEIVKGDVTLIR